MEGTDNAIRAGDIALQAAINQANGGGVDTFFLLLAFAVFVAAPIIIKIQWSNPAIQVVWRHMGGKGQFHPWRPWKNQRD